MTAGDLTPLGKSLALKGTHWYNNGIIQIQAKECPEGFNPGRLKF